MELFGSNFNLFRKREATHTRCPFEHHATRTAEPQGADYMAHCHGRPSRLCSWRWYIRPCACARMSCR